MIFLKERILKTMKKFKCLNALNLKIFAMFFMLCDHLWATLIPGNDWLTNIGRMAFPIFAFQIAEGYTHTHDFKKYLKRIFLFALISEIPFNLMYSGSFVFPFHQNVLFTFCIALLFLKFMDWGKNKGNLPFIITVILSCFLGYFTGMITMCDYFGFGILTVFLFYLFDDSCIGWAGRILGMIFINVFMMDGMTFNISLSGHTVSFPQQAFALFSLIFIWMYNKKPGNTSRTARYCCYAFYPVHMLILAFIWLYVIQ